MKPQYNFKFVPFLLILVIMSMSVFAYMPNTHEYLNKQALNDASESAVGKIITQYYDDFTACTVLTDISVFYYFSEGFTAIGKEYKATHSQGLCTRMVSLAKNDKDLACAYGVCAHLVADSVAHNTLVPSVIKNTYVPNGIAHIFTEQKVDNSLNKKYDKNAVSLALMATAAQHKEQFRTALVQSNALSNINFDAMYDTFVAQVVGNAKYSVGFYGFSAIPMSIHVMLILIFLLNIGLLVLYFKRSAKNIFSKIFAIINTFVVSFIALVYVLFFTGNIWRFFQFISTPVSAIIPITDMSGILQTTVTNLKQFMNSGAGYVSNIVDPAGSASLMNADASGGTVRLIFMIIIGLSTIYLAYLSFKKRR